MRRFWSASSASAPSAGSAPHASGRADVAPADPSSVAASAPSIPPPPSAPGWFVDASAADLGARPRGAGRWRRSGIATLGVLVAALVAGAVIGRARIPTARVVLEAALPSGIVLEDVVVDGHMRLPESTLTLDAQRGFNACNLPDPLGLGPYAPYRSNFGFIPARIAIPQQGGHTPDFGYDVIVHFHGGEAVRKQLVPVVRGAVFVAIDLGLGSGPYAEAFAPPERWPRLNAEIIRALRTFTGDERAHIRHLGLTSWSAGYGAVNEILKVHGSVGIDAVVLLDSMHVGQNYAWPRRDGSLESLSPASLQGLFDFAAEAVAGEKIFVLSHSNIVPLEGYASVRRSADLLLHELGLERTEQKRRVGLMDQLTTADQGRVHVWGFAGGDEKAHCGHASLLGPIVHDLLEAAWETPAMNRDVPMTPAAALGR